MFDLAKFNRDLHRVEASLKRRFKGGGEDLGALMHQAGRRLPRYAHRDAALILQAKTLSGHPRLSRQIDQKALRKPFRRLENVVGSYDGKDRRKGLVLSVLSTMAFNLLVLAAVLVAFVRWHGLG